MEKSSNSSKIVGDAFRGPSGYETVDEQPLPETRGRVLGLGLLAAAVILCAVVFVAVPSPSSGAGANTHGLAMRCVDNSARVVPRPRTENAFRPRRPRRRRCLTSNLVGDCCPSSSGKNLACCRDGTNIATVTRTAKGACDDNSACAALGLAGLCCPGADGAFLGCCGAANNTARKPHSVSARCALNLGCKKLGLGGGNCCPTDAGTTLGCCPPVVTPKLGLRA